MSPTAHLDDDAQEAAAEEGQASIATFSGARALLRTARCTLTSLEAAVADVLASATPREEMLVDEAEGVQVHVIWIEGQPPQAFRSELMAIVDQIRAALDQALRVAAFKVGRMAATDAFPLADSRPALDAQFEASSLPPALMEIVRALRPYPSGPRYRDGDGDDKLSCLRVWSSDEAGPTLSFVPDRRRCTVSIQSGCEVRVGPFALPDGRFELLQFPLGPPPAYTRQLQFTVGADHPDALRGQSVITVLEHCCNVAGEAVTAMEVESLRARKVRQVGSNIDVE